MTVLQIEQTPEWREKQEADAKLLADMQAQLNASSMEKGAWLDNSVPSTVLIDGKHIFLSDEDKANIIMYAFIGLSELVSASSNQPMVAIWKACIERGIRNLKKDGLLA